MKKQTYIIEHLEPKLWEWCFIEYENISNIVGKKNLWFTNIKNKREARKLEKIGKPIKESVSKLGLKNICVLDPEAKKTLNKKDADKFDYFIFGGILGDYPPRKRTKKELTKYIKNNNARNIGKIQMSTDNAVYTVFHISLGKNMKNMKFKDNITIKINEFESFDMPYRYNIVKGKPFMSMKIIDYLKKKQ